MSYHLKELHIDALSDDELKPIVEVSNSLNREAEPRSVDLAMDEFRLFTSSPGITQHRFLVEDGEGAVVALAAGRYPDDGTNADLLLTMIRVLPDHRRQGLGTTLLRRLVELAEELGRSKLQGVIFDTVPAGGEFARAVGASQDLDFHLNVVRIADIDRGLMQEWAGSGELRAPGYSVELFEGAIPDALHADIAHLYYVLERDMPMRAEFEPREWTAEKVKEQQDHYMSGTESLAALAFDGTSGKAVGMSQLLRRKADPTTWLVTVTMVDPEHRGKAIGKWVKGIVNVAAFDRWEGGVYEETGNAFTNEAMLAINRAMGFEHEVTITDCAVSAADARQYLEARGA